MRALLLPALALLLAATGAACTIDRDVSQRAIERGITSDIEETQRPATSDSRVVWPTQAPPIENGDFVPAEPPMR